jgi:membrane-bound lytic murein transglycosylase MltF
VAQLRKEAATRGFDANRWFNNVEVIVSERVGQETVRYVANIYKYYIAYKLVSQSLEKQARAKSQP